MSIKFLPRLAHITFGALLVGALLAIGVALQSLAVSASAQPAATTTPAPEQPGDGEPGFNPFPSTDTMTDTVYAVLRAYNERAAAQGIAPAMSEPLSGGATIVHLPMVMHEYPSDGQPTPTPRPSKPADISITIWPAPSIRVARGGTLEYEIRIKNYGKGIARETDVTLPFDSRQLQVTDFRRKRAGDWVSKLSDNQVTVTFGEVRSGEATSATIVFRVGAALAADTVLSVRGAHAWSDNAGGGSGLSNWAPVLVGGGNDSAPWVWTIVTPLSGGAGTSHRFFSDRFIPEEGIITWLNTPSGVKGLDLRGQADAMGRVYLDFKSSGLKAGTYQMVLYGARSGLTGVATFYVL